jgi:hypothetical protein
MTVFGTRHAFSQSPLSHAHHPFVRPVFKGSNGPLIPKAPPADSRGGIPESGLV